MTSDLRARFNGLKKVLHYTKGGVESMVATYGSLYWKQYTQQAYLTGVRRSFTEARRGLIATGGDLEGSRAEFMRLMSTTIHAGTEDLAVRLHTELSNTASDLYTRLQRVLADGVSLPQQRVRQLLNEQIRIGFRNAQRVVQTEVTRSHANGQLAAYEKLGVQRVGVMIEWTTSGLGRTEKGNLSPCKVCKPMEHVVLTLKEAKGLLPRHPNCKCGFKMVTQRNEQQVRQRREIQRAIRRSIKAEGNRSTWSGAKRKIAPRR